MLSLLHCKSLDLPKHCPDGLFFIGDDIQQAIQIIDIHWFAIATHLGRVKSEATPLITCIHQLF